MKYSNKILISRCFLGEKVTYRGDDNELINNTITKWKAENKLVPICPEVTGGLSVPRQPAEIQSNKEVVTHEGENVSLAFQKGAEAALSLCLKHNIKFALLKESSPSCGSSTIYDGTFTNQKISGEGVTTALLRKNGIHVYSEKTIEQLFQDLTLTTE